MERTDWGSMCFTSINWFLRLLGFLSFLRIYSSHPPRPFRLMPRFWSIWIEIYMLAKKSEKSMMKLWKQLKPNTLILRWFDIFWFTQNCYFFQILNKLGFVRLFVLKDCPLANSHLKVFNRSSLVSLLYRFNSLNFTDALAMGMLYENSNLPK